MLRKYAIATGSIAVQAGRVFGNSVGPNALVLVTPSLGLSTTYYLGFGVRLASQNTGLNTGAQGFYLEKGPTEQCHIEFQNNAASFEIKIMRAATQVAITTSAFGYGVWHHFEIMLTVDPATGAYELRHNEVSILSGSGVNLANTATSQADLFAIRFSSNASATFFIDDVNLKDSTGTENNSFLGDFIIEGKLPNANGVTIQWTNDAGSGSNFENVDDPSNASPDDTGVGGTNSSDTVGQKDLYAFQDLSEIDGSIAFVQVGAQLAMLSTGSRNVKIKFRDDGGTEADVATVTVAATAFDEFYAILDQNPAVPADWDVTDINGGSWGVEIA